MWKVAVQAPLAVGRPLLSGSLLVFGACLAAAAPRRRAAPLLTLRPVSRLQVVVLWTANTERYSQLAEGLNDTADNLLASIERDESEIAPSTIYATACVLEGVPFVNGSPQNTFVPGLIELAVTKGVLIGGDDFKSGQVRGRGGLV